MKRFEMNGLADRTVFIYMSKRFYVLISALLCALGMSLSAHAQQNAGAAPAAAEPQLADFIVAIVQHEPITNSQVRAHVLSLRQQYAGQQQPPAEQLRQMALQQLISQSALAQRAHEHGLRVDPQTVQQAIATIARNNGMSVVELQKVLSEQGIPFSTMERDIGQQLLISQLRERTLDPTVTVSNAEVEAYLAQFSGQTDPGQQQINLAQILIAVPENATPAQEKALEAKAQDIYTKAQAAGADFFALAQANSDDPAASATRGVMGARPASRYPDLFIQAVTGLRAGAIAPPVRSGAGFHIIKVLEREQSDMVVTQTRVRHILLNITEQQTEQDAINKLLADKHQIETGQATFEMLAQEQSQDASAKDGGDLGWVVPGMFVPEFERVMNQLKPGEISDPVATRFGVHLIQVLERRESQLTPQQQREVARESIHQRKVEQAMDQWVRDIQSSAYIEMRNPPQ